MRVAFVIPYFGKFKNYFQLFLNSCATNSKNFDWIIFTDDKSEYDYPPNVKVHYTSFPEVVELIKKKLNMDISIEKAYKLCDYKPAYGVIFEDYLKDYDAWGYCDTDVIWGDIAHFINEDMLITYDKIGDLGHCTVVKNTSINNNLFMEKLNGKLIYKSVFGTQDNCSFDEEYNNSINNIFLSHGLKILPSGTQIANVYNKTSNFKLTYLEADHTYRIEKKSKNIFVWNKGILTRIIKEDKKLVTKEYMYLHMQSRKMNIRTTNRNHYKIIPNSFDNVDLRKISWNSFPKYKHFNMHYFKLRSHNLFVKTMKIIKKA